MVEEAYVVIDEAGNIWGIYEIYDDAWDRQQELGVETSIEEYIMNQDVVCYEDEDNTVVELARIPRGSN